MTAKVEPTPGPARDATRPGEDFLFHLYRGSELLGDSRLIEAQSELEYALSIEPLDERTRGLLATVYFRSGFFSRAMAMYDGLLALHPGDPSLRLNVALCHLRTGEPDLARVGLEALAAEDVSDLRAWGYLALALARLGYVDQAREAFDRAGQPDLARRMVERGASPPRPTRAPVADAPDPLSRRSRPPPPPTFEPLDGGELNLEVASPAAGYPAVREPPPQVPPAPLAPPRLDTLAWGAQAAALPQRAWLEPAPLGNFLEDARASRLGDPGRVMLLGARLARVDVDPERSPKGFAFRLESLRSYAGALDPEVLPRRTRAEGPAEQDGPGEIFGGVGAPFAAIHGPGHLVVGPRPSHRLQGFTLEGDLLFLREELMLGFDLSLAYENGRLALGSSAGEAVPLVQLQGDGAVLLELTSDLLALEVKTTGLTLRKELVVGWVGRLLPRPLSAGEAPCGQRGLLAFAGDGTVLVSAK